MNDKHTRIESTLNMFYDFYRILYYRGSLLTIRDSDPALKRNTTALF